MHLFHPHSFSPVLGTGQAGPSIQYSVLGPSLQERHWGAAACPEKTSGAGEESGAHQEQLREMGVVLLLEKRNLRGDLISFHDYFERICIQVGVSLFSQETSVRMTGSQGRFRLDIMKNFSMERLGKHCNRLFREVIESPSLGVFKNHMHVAFEDLVYW